MPLREGDLWLGRAAGAEVRLGTIAGVIEDLEDGVHVVFSDGRQGDYDLVIGADGIVSRVRLAFLPHAARPEFTGQGGWRYNLPRPPDLDALRVYNGPTGAGLVPISAKLMYLYVTTPEIDNPRCPRSL